MIGARYMPLVLKHVWRRRARTVLTVLGVGAAMFLFVAVRSLQDSVRRATSVLAADRTLVVYRENRFCPATSRLPERYKERIARVPGVADVVPMQIVVSNCGVSLDVVTFRGVEEIKISSISRNWEVVEGSVESWRTRPDGALVGERLARRRGLTPGGPFSSSGVMVTVMGIVRSEEPQDQNVAYVHLGFLQRVATRAGAGVVTQFNVSVEPGEDLEQVASAIDDQFRADSDPTRTRPEKAFVAQAGSDIVEIVAFTGYLGWGCLVVVLALLANAIVISVQERVGEHGLLRTLGYRSGLIARMIIAEGVVIGLTGGALGAAGALLAVHFGNLSLTNEGLSVNLAADWRVAIAGIAAAAGVGVLAGLAPAWRAGRHEIASCFRVV